MRLRRHWQKRRFPHKKCKYFHNLYNRHYFVAGGSGGKCIDCGRDLEEDVPEDTFRYSSEWIIAFTDLCTGLIVQPFVVTNYLNSLNSRLRKCQSTLYTDCQQNCKCQYHLLYFYHFTYYNTHVC